MSILLRTQQSLSIELKQHKPRSTPALEIKDPFILTSALQKGLRRGDGAVATAAARSLLALDAARLWRRTTLCSFEDFGLADLDLTASIVAAASDNRWRAQVGGDDRVMTYLIEQMTAQPRDRRVDALYMLAVRHVRHPASRVDFLAQRPTGTATNLVLRAERLVVECEQEVPNRTFRSVLAAKCDLALQDMADAGIVDDDLHSICAQGRRTSLCLLPILVPLVKRATEDVGAPTTIVAQAIPEVCLIGDVPSYAYCGYTRLGQEALTLLSRSDRDVARVVGALRGKARMDALTYLLFEADGGVCTQELSDPLYEELKSLALGCWTGLPREIIPDAIETMRAALPILNDIRDALALARAKR